MEKVHSDFVFKPVCHYVFASGFYVKSRLSFLRRDVKLTTHLPLVPTSRVVELPLHSSIRLHGVVFN
jgi:hypothetical protein